MNRLLLASLTAAFTGLAMLAAATASAQAPPARELKPDWTRTLAEDPPGRFEWPQVAISYDGGCVAIAHGGTVHIVDGAGRDLWSWNYRRASRYLTSRPLAVSPSCDAIAMVGHAGYRYTWIVDRQGTRAAVRTTSTPEGVAFDRRGELVAIGTAGSDVQLHSRTGARKWKATFTRWCCVARILFFSADNGSIVVSEWGVGLLTATGQVLWSSPFSAMSASRDLRTFAASWSPNHGPGLSHVAALDETGRELWRRFASSDAVISGNGDRITARINENQEPVAGDEFRDQKSTIQIMSRIGSVVATFPGLDGNPIAISPSGDRIALQTRLGVEVIDASGNHLYELPLEPSAVVISEDFTILVSLTSHGRREVRRYRLE